VYHLLYQNSFNITLVLGSFLKKLFKILFIYENHQFQFFNRVKRTTIVLFLISDLYFLIIALIFKNSKEMKFSGFQGSQFSQVFEPLVFKVVIAITISK